MALSHVCVWRQPIIIIARTPHRTRYPCARAVPGPTCHSHYGEAGRASEVAGDCTPPRAAGDGWGPPTFFSHWKNKQKHFSLFFFSSTFAREIITHSFHSVAFFIDQTPPYNHSYATHTEKLLLYSTVIIFSTPNFKIQNLEFRKNSIQVVRM